MPYTFKIKTQQEYEAAWQKSVSDPEGFWADIASSFYWRQRWERVLEWNFRDPEIQWFKGGKLNITENCLDRHLGLLGNQPAIIWEPNDPEEHHRVLTYRDLYQIVIQFANVLMNNGVK